uniref:NADH dehydrogenase subunit 4 n=1 Tax=Thysanostoma flagellatum TaxID=3287591 RepID=UPI001FA7883D|nr:NADH dehydrogenase subunit 4 [Acromitus flagellatus]UMY76055.1 NADH dehydrogenase subunit 4 [Acromitus flagellatus]
MITTILIILIISIFVVSLMNKEHTTQIKRTGLLFSFIVLWLTIMLWINESYHPIFQFSDSIQWLVNKTSTSWGPLSFGIDKISLPFITLTSILTPVCLLISWNTIKFLVKEFVLMLLLVHFLLIIVFTSLNILLFYITFEGILIPVFLIIGIWGSRKEKERAAYYFFFFTLVGSLFMLLGIFALYTYTGSLDFQLLTLHHIPKNLQVWIFLGFFLSLAVKVPKIPVHIWLPQAHVEAPVAGSVLLAGILLKLGGYGFARFSWTLFPYASEFFTPLIILLSSIAIVYASLSTCRQTDAKKLVAYSSVAHMGLVTIGVFSKTPEGLIASIILMVAHGFVSSGLFIAVTNLYDRFHTRTFKYFRGNVYTMPLFTSLLFILLLANIAFPISINFIGEFMSILSISQLSIVSIICPLLGMILSGVYSLLLFNRISFGYPSNHSYFSRDLSRREFQTPLLLVLFTLILGLLPTILSTNLNTPFY